MLAVATQHFSSAQQLEDFAGAFDQLLLEWSGIKKFEAMVEAHAIADDTAYDKLHGVVRNQELENHAGTGVELSRQEEAHASTADITSLPAKVQALTIEEHGYAHGNYNRMAFPKPMVLLGIHLGFWLHCWHPDIPNVSYPVLSDNPTTVTKP